MTTVRNWARNQQCEPDAVERPNDTAEVAALVVAAAASNRPVKVIGAGHSFTAAAMTDGVLVSLGRLGDVVDISGDRVTVQAGIELRDLSRLLDEHGLAMPNLGDINVQSLAGATATATHGTGRGLGNLATTIEAIELVDGRGEVHRFDVAADPDAVRTLAVGVGGFGIVTELTLRVVPAFDLHAKETVEPLADVVSGWDAFTRSADHAEFFFFPGDDRALVKRNDRTDEPARPPSRLAYVRDKYLFENVAFGLACAVGRRWPSLAPRITNAFAASASERDLIDRSDRVFASPRKVRFVEMEYGIPIDAVPEALARVQALVASLHHPVLLPIEVRCSAADDLALSTGYGRESGWIAVHQYPGMPYEHYFDTVEQIMSDYDGRPHWGKLHGQTADVLRERYPRWDDAMALRDRLDPDRTFRNAYLDRVFG
ncbi:L-gulonolactone oxidase [Ilumatobacter fluminis]|uniref:L-gulonolactone oxidase n=1 Tax=Ilumatobacter fluminis TaxID=467091 RepID=A0A4R7I4R7_9ACTN|nr:D-arabinono-1,4-lactone oxidase [Ilumatobacter fluminis]TDT18682.1 L-gulonolactone oxidase [Ilumatobacter fluminis]